MPRRRYCRRVLEEPNTTFFKPAGIKLQELEEIVLAVEEYEALRVTDFLGLNQTMSAQQLHVSQPTFCRVLASARKKVAQALVEGKAIRIIGGTYRIGADNAGITKT